MELKNRYVVVLTATDPASGEVALTKSFPCLSVFDAKVLHGNISEALELLTPFLPGFEVNAFEIVETVQLTEKGRFALEEQLPPVGPEGRNAQWWAEAIGLK